MSSTSWGHCATKCLLPKHPVVPIVTPAKEIFSGGSPLAATLVYKPFYFHNNKRKAHLSVMDAS